MQTYKGHQIIKSNYTTETTRYCYGIPYKAIVHVYFIEGEIINETNPFKNRNIFTSVKSCKEYINFVLSNQ